MTEAAKSVHAQLLWRLAHQFVEDAQRLLDQYAAPQGPMWTNHFRQAAFAIPVNILEGMREAHAFERRLLLEDARNALQESRYYLLLAAEREGEVFAPLLQQTEEMARLLDEFTCPAPGRESQEGWQRLR